LLLSFVGFLTIWVLLLGGIIIALRTTLTSLTLQAVIATTLLLRVLGALLLWLVAAFLLCTLVEGGGEVLEGTDEMDS
jgi:hypothetical protein